MINYQTGTQLDDIDKLIKIIDEPIISVFDEDEILFLTKAGKQYLGVFLDSKAKTSQKVSIIYKNIL